MNHPTVVPNDNVAEMVYKLIDRTDAWNTHEVAVFESRSDAILDGVRRKNDRDNPLREFSVRERELQ